MKKNIIYIATVALMAMACVEENFKQPNPFEGDEVLFSATLTKEPVTRTIYGEEVKYQLDEDGNVVLDENGNEIELTSPEMVVNWVHGDKIKVWASEIASRNEAEYSVNTNNQVQNYAVSLDKTGDYGIQWGTETSSDFCAIYPSDNVSKFEKNGDAIIASTSINATQNNVFAAVKDANGDVIGWDGTHFGNDAANPSMQNAIMFARTADATPTDESGNPKQVNLHFKPYTTVLKFRFLGYTSNLTNPTVYIQNITVKAPEGVAIAGDFNLGISGTGADAAATATLPTEAGKSASDSIRVTTILPGGTYIPLKAGQYVDFNVYTIPQSYQMNATDKLWTVTIYTQGHGKFTYKMKPIPVNNGDPVTYNLTAGEIHKVKIPSLPINSQIEWNPENWITQIPVPVYVSELSVPGAWYCTNGDYQSTTDLPTQYKAGIRAFNIDCRLTYKDGRSGDMDLYCAGSEGSFLGSITSEGKTVLKAMQEIAALIPEDEYVVVVLTIAEKPKEDSGTTLGTVDPKEVLNSIATLLTNNGSTLGVYGFTEATKGKTITADTTIDDVLDHMIVKVNANTIANAGTSEQGLSGVTGFLNYTTIPNTLISYASMAPASSGDIVIGVYDSMQTSPIFWGKGDASLAFHYHQAQRTTYSGTYETKEWSWESFSYVTVTKSYEVDGVPTYDERKAAIDDIIAKSKDIYDAGTHNAWFQIGIGGSRKNSNDDDNASSRTEVAERLNPYLYGKIVSKMDTDPSPVGIVLMNYCTSTTDYTATVDGQSYTASSQDLVQAIIEMNGKFYLNRVGGSITTGDGTNNSGNGTTTTETKNAAYAVVGDNAF